MFVHFLSLVFIATFTSAASNCGSDTQAKILQHIFQKSNRDVRPPPGHNATLVSANMGLSRVSWIDEKHHQFTIDMYFRTRWNDPCLEYEKIASACPNFDYISILTEDGIAKLWKPNLFFPSEVEGEVHNVLGRNQFLRVYPNGDILYSIHIRTTLYCTGIGSYPGEYMCPMKLYSYGLEKSDLILKWDDENAIQLLKNDILIDDYILGKFLTREEDLISITGDYSQLIAEFHFLRKGCLA